MRPKSRNVDGQLHNVLLSALRRHEAYHRRQTWLQRQEEYDDISAEEAAEKLRQLTTASSDESSAEASGGETDTVDNTDIVHNTDTSSADGEHKNKDVWLNCDVWFLGNLSRKLKCLNFIKQLPIVCPLPVSRR